jgi:hypothetical protein
LAQGGHAALLMVIIPATAVTAPAWRKRTHYTILQWHYQMLRDFAAWLLLYLQ